MSFKGIAANFKGLKSRLWINVFIRVGVIFAVFVIVLTVANGTLLSGFFCARQKKMLINETARVARLDVDDSDLVREVLSDISEKHNFDVEIYNDHGRILYTTHGSQMMDFFIVGRDNFAMSHEEMKTVYIEELNNGITYIEAIRRFDNSEFLLCRKEITSGIFTEIRTQKQLITSSAKTASEFIAIVALICFMLSVVWIIIFARKFARPISRINEITRDMARLDFSRKAEYSGNDEIGELADSVNAMSDSLSRALYELECSNKKLRDEIELERQLDLMRRGFVANVSHELKTPISIISGYAEGLKLNVNSDSREKYCDIIIDESERMNRLVLSILELSRYESGQMPQTKESFDICLMAKEITERIFKNSGIELCFELPEGCIAFSDISQTEQILKAYLENALAHTARGGRVTVSCEDKAGRYLVSVLNTGEKIPEEDMPHIWESFWRGDSSHKREKSRFGLGLSIVSAIIKNNGCECGVYNADEGVCFWFTCDKEN